MISVILSILKFILIILACIIGLLILIICLILFVPIRYEADAKFDKSISADGRVSWLLRILNLRFSYVEEILNIKITVFGITLFETGKDDEAKSKAKSKAKRNFKRKAKREKDIIDKDNIDIDIKEDQGETKDLQKDDSTLDKQVIQPDIEESRNRSKEDETSSKPGKSKFNIKAFISEKLTLIKELIFKLLNIIKNTLIKIYKFLLHIESDEESAISKLNKGKTFLKDNKLGIKAIIDTSKKLINHIKPRKISGDVEFGFDNPAITGQVLGIIAIFYSRYYESFKLTPNFEEKILKGQIFVKGRIRIFSIAIIIVKLILNKNFQTLFNNYKVLKEDL